ncbi:MAG: hypothetical protein ACJAZF_004154, partial [Granulosicoccus sp.]
KDCAINRLTSQACESLIASRFQRANCSSYNQ